MKKYIKLSLIFLLGTSSLFASSCKGETDSFVVINNFTELSLPNGDYTLNETWNETTIDSNNITWTESQTVNKTVNKNSDSPEFELVITSIKISQKQITKFPNKEIYNNYKSQYTNVDGFKVDDDTMTITYSINYIYKETDENRIQSLSFDDYKNYVLNNASSTSQIDINQTKSKSITEIIVTDSIDNNSKIRTYKFTKK